MQFNKVEGWSGFIALTISKRMDSCFENGVYIINNCYNDNKLRLSEQF